MKKYMDNIMKKKLKISHFQALNKEERQAYEKIKEAVVNGQKEASFVLKNDDKRFFEVFETFFMDYPEIECIMNKQKHYLKQKLSSGKALYTGMWKYEKKSVAETKKLMDEIHQNAVQIINKAMPVRPKSQKEMVRKIYCYMADKYHYSKSINDRGDYPKDSYYLTTMLHDHGVCSGISKCFTYVLRLLDIPVLTVYGDADGARNGNKGGHCWNMVKLNGKYYHLDLTWDCCCRTNSKYYLLDDVAMQTKCHFWKRKVYPKCLDAA